MSECNETDIIRKRKKRWIQCCEEPCIFARCKFHILTFYVNPCTTPSAQCLLNNSLRWRQKATAMRPLDRARCGDSSDMHYAAIDCNTHFIDFFLNMVLHTLHQLIRRGNLLDLRSLKETICFRSRQLLVLFCTLFLANSMPLSANAKQFEKTRRHEVTHWVKR
jgi:hypothetical protein